MHKFIMLAILIGSSVSNSVLAANEQSISWKDIQKVAILRGDYKDSIFDVVILNSSGSIESTFIDRLPPEDHYNSRRQSGHYYREKVHSIVKHYNESSNKGKAILRHCRKINDNKHNYWDAVYYHCDKKEEFQDLLRIYVQKIKSGKGCLLGGFPVCAYEVFIDIPNGHTQLGLALIPVFGWIANSLLYHVGIVVQATNGKWYAMQKENNGTNTMAEYNSFAEARDRIYRTCGENNSREWNPCSPQKRISKDELCQFNKDYNSSYDLFENNCKDYSHAFKKKFDLKGEGVGCKCSDGSWRHVCTCKN